MNRIMLLLFVVCVTTVAAADDLGRLSANPYAPDSTSNPYSSAGSPYSPTSVRNPYGPYGSPYSNQSATNPYASDPPKLFDQAGWYRGELSANPAAPDSVSNPYGRYGSRYSPDSINNPYGAGSPYAAGSPTNPFGQGWRIVPGGQAVPLEPASSSPRPQRAAIALPRFSTTDPVGQAENDEDAGEDQ